VGKIDCKHELKKYCPLTLRVYDYQQREPTECPINPILVTYKYLGAHLDLRCKNSDAFVREKEKADTMLSHLLTQTGSLQPKINYI
jgi:hypothetical protein